MSNLLSRDSRFLAPAVFDKGDLWHCNTGWFEHADAGLILNNVNVAASRVILGAETREIRVGITHLQEFRFTEHPLLTGDDAAIDALDKTMGRLHISNKALLRDMILAPMQRDIGLVAAGEPRESS